MKEEDAGPEAPNGPRRSAERRLQEAGVGTTASGTTELDQQRLVHELQAHQIELEMQNEELRRLQGELQGELEVTRKEWEDLFEFAPVGYCTLDGDGTILRLNVSGASLLGSTRSHLLKKRLALYITEASRPTFSAFLAEVMAGRPARPCDVAVVREGAEPTVLHLAGTANMAGTTGRITMTDVTASRNAEEALQKRGRLLQQVQQLANVGYFDHDLRENRVEWSDQMYRIFCADRARGPLTYEQVAARVHPDDRAYHAEVGHRTATEGSATFEHRLVWPDGSVHTVWGRTEIERAEDGQPCRIVGMAQDITERKRAEEALRASEQLFRSVLENMQDAYFRADSEGRYVLVSPSASRIFGYDSAEELMAVPASDLYADAADRKALLRDLRGGTGLVDWIGQARRKDGTLFWVSMSAHFVHDEEGHVVGTESVVRDITERTETETALRESERRFRDLLRDVAGVPVQGYTMEGITTYWNKASEALYGYTEEEALGRSLIDLVIPPEAREGVMQAMRQMAETGQPVPSSELILMRKDGSRVSVFSSHAVTQVSGRPAEMFCLDVDMTDRQRAEAALRESEDRFRSVVEGAAMPIFVSLEMKYSYLNPAALRLFGATTPEQVLGQPVLSRIHPDCHESIRRRAVKVLQGQRGVAPPQEEIFLRLDGTPVPVEATASPITYQGQPAAVVFVQDITERKRAEEALRASETKYRQIIETTHEGVWQVDAEMKTVFVNRRMAEMLGYSPDEMYGRPVHAFMTSESRELAERKFASVRIGTAKSHDRRFVRKVGTEIRTLLSTSPFFGADGSFAGAVAMVTDITERVLAEEEVRSLKDDLERRVLARTAELEAANNEMEAFSYSVSHDLRAPLRAIEGFSGMIVKDSGEHLNAEDLRRIDVIRTNARNMSALIDDLLTFSRAGRHEIQQRRISMNPIARLAFDEVAGDVEARARIDFRLGTLPNATGDDRLIRQVWVNLLGNAVKFSAGQDRPLIEVNGGVEGGIAVYRVRDNGVGFDPRYADKLFGVFQRLHGVKEFDGTGIGLALVKRIVERHGGRVWAEGDVGMGATFSFSLPANIGIDAIAATA